MADLPDDGRRVLCLLFAAAVACFFLATFASSSRPTSSLLDTSANTDPHTSEITLRNTLNRSLDSSNNAVPGMVNEGPRRSSPSRRSGVDPRSPLPRESTSIVSHSTRRKIGGSELTRSSEVTHLLQETLLGCCHYQKQASHITSAQSILPSNSGYVQVM